MKKKISKLLTEVVIILLTLVACTPSISNTKTAFKVTKRDYWPTKEWKNSIPEKQTMNSNKLIEMDNYIKQKLPFIRSVLVVKNGYLVFEKYYQHYSKKDHFVICSDTKTVTSALIGIAIKEGYIKGVNQKITEFFPEFITNQSDPKLKEISIENLLTMTSGISWDDNYLYRPEVHINPIKYAFSLKVVTIPGKVFNYSTMDSQILSGIITKSTGMSELAFADKYLFKPLGISDREWKSDAQGYSLGGMELYLRTQDMAKFGYLLLNNGIWNESQIIPSEWVADMTKKHNGGGLPHGESYGLHCWVTKVKGHNAYFAGGFGGQFIYEVPDLDLVVAISSNIDMNHEENRNIVDKFIIPSKESKEL
jgi:CubicO group peptidase (beta-lactamase class C family)